MANALRIRSNDLGFHDACVFFLTWLRDPVCTGAIAPSSRKLAELITSEITLASAPIIELGPGTGVFTRALLARGIPEDRVALVECNSDLALLLSLRFPVARVFCKDAARLSGFCPFGGECAGAVISGLPLVSMSLRRVMAILGASFRHMRSDAAFYQFTYGPRCPVPRAILDRLGLKAKRLGSTFANLLPAAVYRIRRRRQREGCCPTIEQ